MKKKIVAAACAILMSTGSHAGLCPPFNEMAVIAKLGLVESALKVAWTTLFKALSGNLLSYDKRELSAMRVATSQVATVAKAEINAAQALMAGKMAALGALEHTKQQLDVYQQFSVLTGQGVDPCAQLEAQNGLNDAGRRTNASIQAVLMQAAAAPGRYSSPESYIEKMLKVRQGFLTKDEEALGFGKAMSTEVTTATGEKFPLAGADTNAGVLFADSADSRVKAAKEAYINHIGGLPDLPIAKETASLPAGKEYLVVKAQKDAVMSAALSSMATVAATNTPMDGKQSKTQAMRELVGQYFGKEASQRWKGWATQSTRGLLVDQLKIDAASLALKAEQYQDGQRQEVLLAATLLADVKAKYGDELETMRKNIDTVRTGSGVR